MTKLQNQRQKEYRAQIARLKRQYRRMKDRGYSFPAGRPPFIPRTIPGHITKRDVDRLRAITAPHFYQYAKYVDPATGEVLTGHQRRDEERKASAQRAAETRKANAQADIDWISQTIDLPAPPPPPPPSDQALVHFLREASNLIEFGGWIRDQTKGKYKGGSYRSFVYDTIDEIVNSYRGLAYHQKFVLQQQLAKIIEGYAYVYQTALLAQNTVDAFNSATAEFESLTDNIRAALLIAIRS